MKRFPSIKKNCEFQKVYKKGKSFANKLLIIYVLKNESDSNRLGISVSKKVGNSVVRHSRSRLLREIFRLQEIQRGYDIVVVVRAGASEANYQKMESAYLHLMRLHGLMKEND